MKKFIVINGMNFLGVFEAQNMNYAFDQAFNHPKCDKQRRMQIFQADNLAGMQLTDDNPAKEQFAPESFIKSVEDAYNTGGGILNDIITLKNGMAIQISEDGLSIYKNDEDRVLGDNVIFWYDEHEAKCWCTSCKQG